MMAGPPNEICTVPQWNRFGPSHAISPTGKMIAFQVSLNPVCPTSS